LVGDVHFIGAGSFSADRAARPAFIPARAYL
jgi:hypothetical protein